MTPPLLSVIICTYNRCECLRQTLQTCCELVIPEGVTWELLVVDNNSTDCTKQACDSFTGKLPLRYLFEPRQGKSFALNRAVAEARAEFLLFTDDDVAVDPGWLQNMWATAQRHPDASFFGGRILPRWEAPPPRWLADHYSTKLLAGMVVLCDDGPAEQPFTDPAVTAKGANLAFRKRIFQQGFAFAPELGPTGAIPTRGEETTLMEQLFLKGHQGIYVPSALVHHLTPPRRMTETYLREWHIGHGIVKVRRGEVAGDHVWFGVPRHIWKKLIASTLQYVATRWTGPALIWLKAETTMATNWGIICECRRQAGLGRIRA